MSSLARKSTTVRKASILKRTLHHENCPNAVGFKQNIDLDQTASNDLFDDIEDVSASGH
jgi:hypothetical protein